MDTNTHPLLTSFGPGEYLVHGVLDEAPFPNVTWRVIVHPDGSGDEYAPDGVCIYHYDADETPAETLRAWQYEYGFRVEKVS
jgi:hypothetical protein